MTKFKINQKENKIIIPVNSQIYPLEAIYGAAYIFLDRAYLFLDGNPGSQITVRLKGKEKLTKKQLKDLAGEFYNELLNCALRDKISKNNQKIRELIVARALWSTQKTPEKELKKEPPKEDWQKDALKITIPWEEKYGKKEPPKEEWQKDTLEVALPWEEKYGKKEPPKEEWKKDTLGVALPWEEKYGIKDKDKEKKNRHASPY